MKKTINLITVFIYTTIQLLGQGNNFNNHSGWFNKYNGTEQTIKEYLSIAQLDMIEGIWSYNIDMYLNGNILKRKNYQKIAIIRDTSNLNRDYIGVVLDGQKEELMSAGVFKYAITCEYQKTAYSNIYLQKGYQGKLKINGAPETENIQIDKEGILRISGSFTKENSNKVSYDIYAFKLFPLYDQKVPELKKFTVSGTAFALTSNGLLVTNNHVIEGVNKIEVRGINGNFDTTYQAKVLIKDKNNDLAILKIDDPNFITLGTIPYALKIPIDSVGESVFVLGYPLRSTMGDEIKLTNGIISSKTGFNGDITSYQLSVPIQPGNSGGPLFDKKGDLIGIINSKHTGAENASYAVKTAYLKNLIELLDIQPTLQSKSKMNNKSLIQQVEIAKKFIYIIEGI